MESVRESEGEAIVAMMEPDGGDFQAFKIKAGRDRASALAVLGCDTFKIVHGHSSIHPMKQIITIFPHQSNHQCPMPIPIKGVVG